MKKTEKKVMNPRFTVDFVNRKIKGSETSFNEAGKCKGPIYEELMAKMAAHPGFECEIVKLEITKTREDYHGMDLAFMRDYIEMKDDTEFSAKFERILHFADVQGKRKYPIAKKYFLKHYNTEDHPFVYSEAKALVEEYRIDRDRKEATSVASPVEAGILNPAA